MYLETSCGAKVQKSYYYRLEIGETPKISLWERLA